MSDDLHTRSRFKTTSWTLIGGAQENRADLERLLGQYWSPVYAFLRRSGQSTADAEDLTQAFLSRVVVDRNLLAQADRERGRFRSFMIASLRRFVIDEYRREHGRRDDPRRVFVPRDPQLLAAAEPSETDEPDRAFHRQWATAVLDATVRRVETACHAEGLTRPWAAFDARVLRPIRTASEPVPVETLREELGAASAQEIYSMLQTVKRKLDRELRAVVQETVGDADEVEAELDELHQFL